MGAFICHLKVETSGHSFVEMVLWTLPLLAAITKRLTDWLVSNQDWMFISPSPEDLRDIVSAAQLDIKSIEG